MRLCGRDKGGKIWSRGLESFFLLCFVFAVVFFIAYKFFFVREFWGVFVFWSLGFLKGFSRFKSIFWEVGKGLESVLVCCIRGVIVFLFCFAVKGGIVIG